MSRLIAILAAAMFMAGVAAAKPLVVIVADPRGAEATDLLTPYAILAESGAVEVQVVSPTEEPVPLTPGKALLKPQMTFAELARRRPEGPDVVIVPALTAEDDPSRSQWLRQQLNAGARIMSICNGARVLAAAGLLDGREATVHWYSRGEVARRYPEVRWRYDRRWVSDGPITTTSGISASEPGSLYLLQQIAGDAVMKETAARLRLAPPSPDHNGEDFRLTFRGAALVVGNLFAFWRHEDVAVPLSPGFDELAFGVTIDAWSRTYRSTAWASGPGEGTVSRRGLVIYPDKEIPQHFDREVVLPGPGGPEPTFERIAQAYGQPTARFVALQFEHPYGALSAW